MNYREPDYILSRVVVVAGVRWRVIRILGGRLITCRVDNGAPGYVDRADFEREVQAGRMMLE